jgi:putative inorganic carbon (HCO3(-)) transporter
MLGTNWLDKIPGISTLTSSLPAVIRDVPGAESGFHPNAIGGTLIWFVPLQVAMLAYLLKTRPEKRGWILMLSVLTAITLGVLLLTQSRGAWLGLALGLPGVFIVYRAKNRIPWLLGYIALILIVITLNVALIPYLPTGDIAGIRDLQTKFVTRQELWSRAIYMIEDFPLTGSGMNSFRILLPTFYRPFIYGNNRNVHPHNHLLLVGTELGIPGMVSYIILWLAAGFIAWRVGKHGDDGYNRHVARGGMGGIVASLVFGMTDVIPLGAKLCIFMWLSFALLQAVYNLETEAIAGKEPGTR